MGAFSVGKLEIPVNVDDFLARGSSPGLFSGWMEERRQELAWVVDVADLSIKTKMESLTRSAGKWGRA